MEERYIVPLYSAVMLYILVAQFFALYFWYLYGKDHGFLASVFIGPIVSEFKGLLFPFFI
jgi:hypothetical protein